MDVRSTAEAVVEGFGRHRLLTYASAIAYQTISALIPFALFALGLVGAIGAESLWSEHLRPDVASSTSGDVFAVVDGTVNQIFGQRQTFWITFGLALTLWQIGGAVRATMEALDDIYDCHGHRSRREKYVVSTLLSAAVGALWLLAIASLIGGRAILGGAAGLVGRYAIAALLLVLATGLTLRIAPSERPPVKWASVGSLVIVGGWLLVVGGYILYATRIASYSSIFGSLAAGFVLIVVAYLSAVVFLTGVLIDAKARNES